MATFAITPLLGPSASCLMPVCNPSSAALRESPHLVHASFAARTIGGYFAPPTETVSRGSLSGGVLSAQGHPREHPPDETAKRSGS